MLGPVDEYGLYGIFSKDKIWWEVVPGFSHEEFELKLKSGVLVILVLLLVCVLYNRLDFRSYYFQGYGRHYY